MALKESKNKSPFKTENSEYWQTYEDYISEKYAKYRNEELPWIGFYVINSGNVLNDEFGEQISDSNADYNYSLFELDKNPFNETLFNQEGYYEIKISEELENKILEKTIDLLNQQTTEKTWQM